ncbi:GNAT family N-acetyltransferase [Engelhardtia mirabilis]|uniref:BioF2-like acetyltransferase domain-containing protein n=1 Tax=Engelhardtia mirabilis TaxID=2528011 RepID=A0A518BNA3_9BACT|nr:hypothetical protein Pla133_35570 [Planctomycetes bacterium Pla133]QDV02785.1 hypothetical protein Pla86_35550 [Planctomycetes bacterium Pla86]
MGLEQQRDRFEAGDGLAYADPDYARAMGEFGEPIALPASGGWLLAREVPGGKGARDLTAAYPLFDCRDWSGLEADLARLRAERAGASVVLVAEPLGAPDGELLARLFPDCARPFKRHFLVDLSRDPELQRSAHHEKSLRRAERFADFERIAPAEGLDEWCALYGELAARFGLTGPSAFSHVAFARHFALDGLSVYRASENGRTTGMSLWLRRGERCWYHLAATDDAGRRHEASYGLVALALGDHATRGCTVADLGGGAGLDDDESSGLAAFKAGWGEERCEAWLCGAVLDPDLYERLCAERWITPEGTDFFPDYRAPAAVGSKS